MTQRRSTVLRAILIASATTTLWSVSSTAGADITKTQCAAANINAQDLRRDGGFAAAHEQLLRCVDPACPALVRDDCTRRLDELNEAQPTIAFEVKDATGADVFKVSITMDGKPWSDALDGRALPVDPGKHVFTFMLAGRSPITRTLMLTENEKGRRERVVLAAPAQAQAQPSGGSPVAASTGGGLGTQRLLGLATGVAGVVALGLGTTFGLMTTSAWSNAKRACGGDPSQCTHVPDGQSYRSTAERDATLSTLGFVAGGALAAAGAFLFFTAHPRETKAAARPVVAPRVGPREAGISVVGAF